MYIYICIHIIISLSLYKYIYIYIYICIHRLQHISPCICSRSARRRSGPERTFSCTCVRACLSLSLPLSLFLYLSLSLSLHLSTSARVYAQRAPPRLHLRGALRVAGAPDLLLRVAGAQKLNNLKAFLTI